MTDSLETALRQLVTARTTDGVYSALVEVADAVLPADSCTLACAVGEEFIPKAVAGDGSPVLTAGQPVLAGVLGHTCRTGRAAVIDDVTDTRSATAAHSPAEASSPIRSLLVVPFEDVGPFVAAAETPAAFTDEDREIAERLVSCAATALTDLDSTDSRGDDAALLDEVASVLSHDLRTPLNVAQGRLELARESGDADDFEQAAAALSRLDELVDDLVTLARTGERIGPKEEVEIRAAAERAWTIVEPGDATLTIQSSTAILADESALRELLENLFRNAIEQGSRTIRVGGLPSGFYVADDGPGIPPADREQVFTYGYSTNPDGTGFGLAIVQRIARAHDWTIALTDGELGGARFEFTPR